MTLGQWEVVLSKKNADRTLIERCLIEIMGDIRSRGRALTGGKNAEYEHYQRARNAWSALAGYHTNSRCDWSPS